MTNRVGRLLTTTAVNSAFAPLESLYCGTQAARGFEFHLQQYYTYASMLGGPYFARVCAGIQNGGVL